MFCHSLVSDWNHGNAHFLRGAVRELGARGHDVHVYEPENAWSYENLVAEQGEGAVHAFERAFPGLRSTRYDPEDPRLEAAVDGADLVLVHEWNDPQLVREVGRLRQGGRFRLLFHDTHHRAVTAAEELNELDLGGYDGVLAFGEVIRRTYLERGWCERAWTWHEAADTQVFRPLEEEEEAQLVWIGNWGDEERTSELDEFLFRPVRSLGLSGSVYGVRYPEEAKAMIEAAGLDYRGWLANHDAPRVMARHTVTVHVPRRPYARLLPGIPTIRVFEALACGIPLVCAPWDDAERLFRPGLDYLVASDGEEMTRLLKEVLADEELRTTLIRNGLETISQRHTCAHRVDELVAICRELGVDT